LLLRWFFISLGGVAVIGGLATLPLPIPLGIPLLLIGLPLLLKYAPRRGRLWILKLAKRHPPLYRQLRRIKWVPEEEVAESPGRDGTGGG